MKFSLIVLALTLLSASVGYADTGSRPLAVFFIHGLSGDENSFNDLPKVVENHFGADRVRVKVLVYDTMNETKGQFAFVDEIAPKMAQFYSEQGLDMAKDPFAIVAHSQGAIIARNYLATCLRPPGTTAPSGNSAALEAPWRDCIVKKGEAPKAPQNMRLLVTLGAPHWGSPIGNRASDSKLLGVLGGGGYAQDKELAIGSTRMTIDRVSMIQSFKKWQKLKTPARFFYPENRMRFVSIAGNVGNDLHRIGYPYRLYLETIASTDINEDDLVVPCSMGNPNFHYYLESDETNHTGANQSLTVESGYVRVTDNIHLVPYPHTDANGPGVLFGNTTYSGISGMKNFDIDAEYTVDKKGVSQYAHLPSLYVLKELSREIHGLVNIKTAGIDNKIKAIEPNLDKKVKEFSSVITVKFPVGYQRRPLLSSNAAEVAKYITMSQKITKAKNEGTIEVLNYPNSIAFKNFGFNNSGADSAAKPQFAFFHAGRFSDKDAAIYGVLGKHATVCYDINLPGYLPKHFCNTVRPGESSYAQIIMEPFRPFTRLNRIQMNNPLLLSDNTVLLGYDDAKDTALTYDFSDRSTKTRGWKDIEPVIISEYVSMNPTTITDFKKQCYYGLTGKQIGDHTNALFATPLALSPMTDVNGIPYLLPPGESLQVVGRYTGAYPTEAKGPDILADLALEGVGANPYGLDRYLVNTKDHRNMWINADDIDILNEKCR